MITGLLQTNRVTSASQEAFTLHHKAQWGERKSQHVEYTFIEALALMKVKKLDVYKGKNRLTETELFKKAKRQDKHIETKLAVFADLRHKGYVVKTALKFGAEFRVYDKGARQGKEHAAWLLFPVKESESLKWYDFVAKNRVATSTNKKLLLAILDDAGDITYYQIGWIRP